MFRTSTVIDSVTEHYSFSWKMLVIRFNTLILFLSVCYADSESNAQKRRDDDCNCDFIGPWQPVFKPSPIVRSELPEHHSPHVLGVYSPRADLKLVPHVLVPVVNPVAYTLHHDFADREQPRLRYSLLDSSVTESVDSNGKPVIKWDHYGDIKQISIKYKGEPPKHKKSKNRLYNHKVEGIKPSTDSQENKSKETFANEEESQKNNGENLSLEHNEDNTACGENDEDEKYFNNESFFDGNNNSQEDFDLPSDLGSSKEISEEDDFPTNFYSQSHSEDVSSELAKENIKAKKPATSYASFSSLFSGIKTSLYRGQNVQDESSVKSPYSNTFTHVDSNGHSQFINHGKSSWFNNLGLKFNGGKPIKYQEKIKAYSVHEHQPDEIRSYGYPKYSQNFGNYYPLNKDYLLGDFWKNARKMEKMMPPSPGQTPTWFMKSKNKKPRTISFKRNHLINSNKPFSYVYIVKTNKDSHPLFINH